MNGSLAPTYSPTYAGDTDATAVIKIHNKGYCPKHPDIKIRSKKMWTKGTYSPCTRCEELHSIYKKRLETVKTNLNGMPSLSDSREYEALVGELTDLECKDRELEDTAVAIINKECDDTNEARKAIFEQKLRMKQVLFNSLNLKRMKIAVLGDGRVGKTSIITRYLRNEFEPRQPSTLQASYLEYADSNVCFSVWDTAGQERFHALAPMYYRDADIVLFVYDFTDGNSFVKVKSLVNEVRKACGDYVLMGIVGNKIDISAKLGQVDINEVKAYCESIQCKHYEVSAQQNTGIDECFTDVVVNMAMKRQARSVLESHNRTVKLGKTNARTSGCC